MLSVRMELLVEEKDLPEFKPLIKAIAEAIINDRAIITKSSIFKISDEEVRRLFSSYYGVKNE